MVKLCTLTAMESREKIAFEQALDILLSGTTPRVWSFIVSIFGDLARNSDDELSAHLINKMTALIGIKPEATRVALHRLRKEEWITVRKSGRNSIYSLTAKGLLQSQAASQRIYGSDVQSGDHWHLVLTDKARAKGPWDNPANGYLALTQNSFFAHRDAPKNCGDHFVISGEINAVPNWVKNRLLNAEKDRNLQILTQKFKALESLIEQKNQLDPVQVATLRSLLVHCWRRAILRYPDVPDWFFPKGWAGTPCRGAFDKALNKLRQPSLKTLDPYNNDRKAEPFKID